MKRIIVVLMILVLAGFSAAYGANGEDRGEKQEKPDKQAVEPLVGAIGPDYVIGPGDVLFISVWKDEALTKDVLVLPDGTISFPLIGRMVAAGRTLSDLKEEIEEKITEYVPDPALTVEVKGINSMVIYIIGRVNSPGRFPINTSINVLQALAMAGGLNPFAKKDKIKIFREEGGNTRIFGFQYDDVAEGRMLKQNITLRKGDIIVVP